MNKKYWSLLSPMVRFAGIFILIFGNFTSVHAAGQPDFVITGYTLSVPTPDIDEPFNINITVKNEGDVASDGAFYRSVFLDRNPSDPSLFSIITDDEGHQGCLYNLATQENDYGDKRIEENFADGIAPGASDTKAVIFAEGLGRGVHQLWLYTDPLCAIDENVETNNVYGPISIVIGTPLEVSIGGAFQESYGVFPGDSIRDSYTGVNNGPIKVSDLYSSLPIIASERVAYTPDGGTTWTSFDEMMGMPSNQLTDTYYFPYYNNVEMNTQLRFGNVGTTNTFVTVTIGGVVQGTYLVTPNQSMRLSYNLNSGPIKVQSSGSVPIIASIRFANIQSTSPLVVPAFTEMMGLPGNQLTTSYIFPYYNNVEMNTQLRFGNVGTIATNVTVTIGGVVQGVYPVAPSQSVRLFYNLNSGPVKVQSSGGVPIIASMRFANIESESPLVISYFSEMLGLPQASLSTNYWFPIYDNVTHNMQLRFGNMGTTSTTVTVRVGGADQGTYTIFPNQSQRLFYNLNDGPVQVQSSGGVPIIASIRFAYIESESPLVIGAFSEMLGLPASQLSSTYLFPWYNNLELDSQVRIAVP